MTANLLYYACEKSVGLWVGAMLYSECDPEALFSNEGSKMLQTGLKGLHDQSSVHGDTRLPNILGYAAGHLRLVARFLRGTVKLACHDTLLT